MKISIAMATYNGENYILEQLQSFMSQTHIPDELIIIDDCSTDNTLSIIEEFKKIAPFKIKLFSNIKNLGYTQNFNRALQLCSNELIFLSDQDDVWFPEKIEYIVKMSNYYPNKALFMIDAELTDSKLNSSGLTKLEQIKNTGFHVSYMVMGCTFAVKKSFLDVILPVPVDFKGHDDWIVRLADFLDLRVIDDKVLQYYRRHNSNVSQQSFNSLAKVKREKFLMLRKIIRWIRNSKTHYFKNKVKRMNLLFIGLEKLVQNDIYKPLAEKAKDEMSKNIKVLEQRLIVLTAGNFFKRLIQVVKINKNKNYKFIYMISDVFKT